VVRLPGNDLRWNDFSALRWRINDVPYDYTIAELFDESLVRLDPAPLGASGAVTAHGDAHNANVWIEERGESPRLVLFDPAFAGEHVPALLAEIKATFHNIYAHRLWLYHPNEAANLFDVDVVVKDGWVHVAHDWALSPLREALLSSKIRNVWQPLLAALRRHGRLPATGSESFAARSSAVRRSSRICAPASRKDRFRGGRPRTSALSFAIAVMAGSEPDGDGEDPFTRFIRRSRPHRSPTQRQRRYSSQLGRIDPTNSRKAPAAIIAFSAAMSSTNGRSWSKRATFPRILLRARTSAGDVSCGAANSSACAAALSSIATMPRTLSAISARRRAANVAMLT
jgi:hypothetical protein